MPPLGPVKGSGLAIERAEPIGAAANLCCACVSSGTLPRLSAVANAAAEEPFMISYPVRAIPGDEGTVLITFPDVP
jgi:hypothetical protein